MDQGRENERRIWTALRFFALALAVGVLLTAGLGAGSARADDDDDDDDDERGGGFCSATARAQHAACTHEVRDDDYTRKAICTNVSDEDARDECFDEARVARREARALCREQLFARKALCDRLGEARYQPSFDPADFDDDFSGPPRNPYYPLRIGNVWSYRAPEESNTLEVLDRTKLIDGVRCVVVNDLVTVDGVPLEDTDDWYAQRLDGSVDYCGESVLDFATFAGDEPPEPELVAIDGSFKAGRDGDLSGTIFLGDPEVGQSYRQEWSAGNAEDAATVLSTRYGWGRNPELDRFVPRALAELLCAADDCVVTEEVTPLEPDLVDRKYYAAGIGEFLAVNLGTGEVNRLVGCNFDPRCAALPVP